MARQILIGAQVAASCVLLIVAGLLVRAMQHAIRANPGFEYSQVISIDPVLHGHRPVAARAYFDELEGSLHGIPGAESVALVSNPPLGNRWTVVKTPWPAAPLTSTLTTSIRPSSRPWGSLCCAGTESVPGDTRAIVVSESLARLRWPAEDPGQNLPAVERPTYGQ